MNMTHEQDMDYHIRITKTSVKSAQQKPAAKACAQKPI